MEQEKKPESEIEPEKHEPFTWYFKPYEYDKDKLKLLLHVYRKKLGLEKYLGVHFTRDLFEEYLTAHYKKLHIKYCSEYVEFLKDKEAQNIRHL